MATKPPTQSQRLETLEEQLADAQEALTELQEKAVTEDDLKAQNKVVADLAAKVRALMARMGLMEPVKPPAGPAPQVPDPAGSAPQNIRSRPDLTRIIVEELAKLTSFIPGNGDLVDPKSAIQLHTDEVIARLNGLQVPEPVLRPQIAARWEMEAIKNDWVKNYPPVPKGQAAPVVESSKPVPKPAAPAPAGGHWSKAMMDEAVRQITTPNEGRAINIPDKEGWYRRGSVVMGVRPRDKGRADWAPDSRFPDDMFWPFFNWWCVVFREVGDPGGGVIQVRRMDDQFIEDGDWYRLKDPSNKIGWGAYYKDHFEYWPGRDLPEGNDSVYQDADSVSVRVKDGTCAHFMSDNGLVHVPNVEKLNGYLATCEVRLDPVRSNPNAKLLFQAGADAKPAAASSSQNGLTWYPGIGVASMQRVTKEWKRFSMAPLEESGVAYAGAKAMNRAFLYAHPPLV